LPTKTPVFGKKIDKEEVNKPFQLVADEIPGNENTKLSLEVVR
jgi:hypothetical protein